MGNRTCSFVGNLDKSCPGKGLTDRDLMDRGLMDRDLMDRDLTDRSLTDMGWAVVLVPRGTPKTPKDPG